MTQKEKVKEFLAGKGWVPSYDIVRYCVDNYITDSMRICRKMAERGEIEGDQRGKFIYYRIRQSDIVRKFEEAKKARTIKDINDDFKEWSKQYTGNLFDF